MSVHQETEGLVSPIIRDLRLRRIAARIAPGSRVLDLACGNGYLRRHLPDGCTYFGVDRLIPDAGGAFSFLEADLMDPGTAPAIKAWMGEPADFIVCAAFLEHLSQPAELVLRMAPVLKEDGALVGTTPHPRGRNLHDSLARLYLCSRSGAAEHEAFLDRLDLANVAEASGGELMYYRQFLFGLNQLFEFKFHRTARQ